MNQENIAWGASLLKELGLWAGVIVSGIMGFLWSIPWLFIAFAGGRGHTSDWVENLLLLCALIAIICAVAMVLFVIGAIRNKVGGDEYTIVHDAGGDTERL